MFEGRQIIQSEFEQHLRKSEQFLLTHGHRVEPIKKEVDPEICVGKDHDGIKNGELIEAEYRVDGSSYCEKHYTEAIIALSDAERELEKSGKKITDDGSRAKEIWN